MKHFLICGKTEKSFLAIAGTLREVWGKFLKKSEKFAILAYFYLISPQKLEENE